MIAANQFFDLTIIQSKILLDQMCASERPRFNVGGYIELAEINVEYLQWAHQYLIENDEG